MAALIIAFGLYFFTLITWCFYLAVMALKRHKKKHGLTRTQKAFAYPLLSIGLMLDIIFNLCGAIVLLDPPQELLFSTKIDRLLNDNKDDWRDSYVDWFAKTFLDPFDPRGYHIKRPVNQQK